MVHEAPLPPYPGVVKAQSAYPYHQLNAPPVQAVARPVAQSPQALSSQRLRSLSACSMTTDWPAATRCESVWKCFPFAGFHEGLFKWLPLGGGVTPCIRGLDVSEKRTASIMKVSESGSCRC